MEGIYIPGIDAKDIIVAQQCGTDFTLRTRGGEPNLRRYKSVLDPSPDRTRLREVYERVYRRGDFSFRRGVHEYTNRVICLTFKYSVANWNRRGKNTYVKNGEQVSLSEFVDCACVRNGVLVGISLGTHVNNPLDDGTLGEYFALVDGAYSLVKNPKKLVSTDETRRLTYENGFTCDGTRYVRWKRSTGSARVGKCLFIDERLYKKMHRWDLCGLDIPDGAERNDLAAIESYMSLPLSSIIDTIEIFPENILVIPDHISRFPDDVIAVSERRGKLVAVKERRQIENSIFDGQGLIDPSVMGQYAGKGMILLRNRFFKSCCFNTNIQQWFRDNGITSVSQLNGQTRAKTLDDIKLIVTPESVKYLKFGTLDQWLDNVGETFGIVKYEKPTHFFDGRFVQTHYQLINTLRLTKEEVSQFLKPTTDFLTLLATDPAVFRYFIHFPQSRVGSAEKSITRNEIFYTLLGLSDAFADTAIFRDFRRETIRAFVRGVKLGHVLVPGNYSVLLGNPMEMLYQAIGRFDGTSILGCGNIHTRRFPYNTKLLGSRSPHVTMANVWIPTNIADSRIDKYFNLTNEIVCINSIGENVLQRLSGCDFDSDTVLLTDNEILINAACRDGGCFPVAVTDVGARRVNRKNTLTDKARLDTATSNNLIGDIIDLSQELNSEIWHRLNNGDTLQDVEDLYFDACKLNTMSCLEIDKAKKEFAVSNAAELSAIRKKHEKTEDGRKVKPNFFARKDIRNGYYNPKKRLYKRKDTAMDYLQEVMCSFTARRGHTNARKEFLPLSAIIDRTGYRQDRVDEERALSIFGLVKQAKNDMDALFASDAYSREEKKTLAERIREDCIAAVGAQKMTKSTAISLLDEIEKDENASFRWLLLDALFGSPNRDFFSHIQGGEVTLLEENISGDCELFGLPFAHVCPITAKKGE